MATLDSVTLTFPRTAVPDVIALSSGLLERMHELLERNTEGTLTPIERQEVETLVEMAQFSQLVALSLQNKPTGTP